jgi:hypothetical protein
MKLLVFSDSHGTVSAMVDAALEEKPDEILFLGDCWSDFCHLKSALPELPMEGVPGNCDYQPAEALERILIVEGKRIFFCHGHTRRVKQGEGALIAQGHRMGADIALYGHTHIPKLDEDNGMWVMNPGSLSRYGKQTYGIIQITQGKITCAIQDFPRG